MEEIIQNIVEGAKAMSLLEIIAVVFGLASVWFAKKENILVFPTGIVSVLLYVYICFNYQFYADMGINAYYFVMSIYGWIIWSKKSDQSVLPISKNTPKENVFSLSLLVLFFAIVAFAIFGIQKMIPELPKSDVVLWDSCTSSFFLVGMLLMARKKIENWLAWIIGDAISVPLYAYKGLYLSSFQFFVFLIIAILGYLEWKRRIEEQKALYEEVRH